MAKYGEESVSSEYGENPESDSPEVQNEEEDFDDDYDNTEWEGDDDFENDESSEIEMPVAPSVDDFQDQESYDQAYEEYEQAHSDFESQMPGDIERSTLDAQVYDSLDRLGMTGSAKPAAREAIAQADNFLAKAMQADLRGDKGTAREQRQRAEYMSRTALEELSKDSRAQVQGKQNALRVAEGVIRNSRGMDDAEYKDRFPQGRGFDADVRDSINAFNDNATGDYVYCIREYSPLDQNLSETQRGLSDGSQLLQVKIPSHFESAKELATAARSSSMSIYDYLVSTGGVSIKPVKEEEPEPADEDRFKYLNNAEYRKQRGVKIKPPQLGGIPAQKRF